MRDEQEKGVLAATRFPSFIPSSRPLTSLVCEPRSPPCSSGSNEVESSRSRDQDPHRSAHTTLRAYRSSHASYGTTSVRYSRFGELDGRTFCRAARAWSPRLRLDNGMRGVCVSDRSKGSARCVNGDVKTAMSGRSFAAGAGMELSLPQLLPRSGFRRCCTFPRWWACRPVSIGFGRFSGALVGEAV